MTTSCAFQYCENEELIDRIENEKLFGDKARELLVRAKISNLRQVANVAEREAGKTDEKRSKKFLAKAIRLHERANELEKYLDQKREGKPRAGGLVEIS